MTDLILIGAGGHARVVIEILRRARQNIVYANPVALWQFKTFSQDKVGGTNVFVVATQSLGLARGVCAKRHCL